MTKLIALIAVLAALGWAVTATASWITRKKAPLAIAAGHAEKQVTAAEQGKAMLRAQLRTVTAVAFAIVMVVALFRLSIGLSGQAGLPIALIAGLSTSGGLLLHAALPATKLPASPPLVARRAFILPAAALLTLAAFVVANGLYASASLGWQQGAPLLLVALAVAGSAGLALRRLGTTASLPDPRMAAMDRRWRELSARNLLNFTGGTLLSYLGGTALMAGISMLNIPAGVAAEAGDPVAIWGIASAAAGAGAALAGVVLLVLAAKGTLTIRTASRERASTPVKA